MHIVVIGGTGHIGTYLCPALIKAGHQVTSVTRGERKPYIDHPLWNQVTSIALDRDAEERERKFGHRIAALEPDAVVDLTCYTLESAQHLTEALAGRIQHFLHCGTIWIYGPSVEVPATEDTPRRPFGEYGCRKLAIEEFLLDRFRTTAFPAVMIHPGHLVGPGWAPINPAGNFNVQVFSQLAAGAEVLLPNFGMETLHHVHASDVAQLFVRAIASPGASIGETFHAVSSQAITMRGYAEAMAAWFGKPPRLRFLPWEEWKETASETDARMTWDHMAHSPNASIAKAQRLLDFAPRYTSLAAVQESVQWLIKEGRV
jgi:nucleoside-diphosphate-sugar epimerase